MFRSDFGTGAPSGTHPPVNRCNISEKMWASMHGHQSNYFKGKIPLTLQSLLFLAISKDPPKKARIVLPAEPLKSLEKRAKAHKKARKTAKRKQRGKRKKRLFVGQKNIFRLSHRPLNGPFQRGRFPPWRGVLETAH